MKEANPEQAENQLGVTIMNVRGANVHQPSNANDLSAIVYA
jgi:hypothetical protein